ncbi:MAG TPA: acyl carrier protein [Pseudonocardiaceae bacterium]|nr:acyl carrier protein [Pseudonocardiaceae bacterium]
MTGQPVIASAELTAESVEQGITQFLTDRIKTAIPPDEDLFATQLVSSIFAMELVVHLESSYGIAILGGDLKLDNFRTVQRMTALVLRLSADAAEPGA